MAPSAFILCRAALCFVLGVPGAPAQLSAQVSPRSPGAVAADRQVGRVENIAQADVDSLVRIALAANPALRAARARVDAAGARILAAGARPDPMLMVGFQNLPLTRESSGMPHAPGPSAPAGAADPMTMRMIGISQALPYPGKLSLLTRAARAERAAVQAELAAAGLRIAAEVKREYYELAYVDRALEIVLRTQSVLGSLISVAEAHYSVGRGTQADVLRSRVEAAHLGEQASELLEQREATMARLNALLDQPSEAPIGPTAIPQRIARAAVSDSATRVRFVSATLGARADDSPLLSLDSLQALAIAHNPMLRAHEDRIDAQRTRVALARKGHLPDVDLALSYGQRPGFPDMVSAIVSIPLPIQRRRKQSADAGAADAELAALIAEHHDAVNALKSEVTQHVAGLERARTQLALSLRAVLPQANANLHSATSAYQVGRNDFASLMDAQATLFNAETAHYRSLSDFAKGLSELERAVGVGVLR